MYNMLDVWFTRLKPHIPTIYVNDDMGNCHVLNLDQLLLIYHFVGEDTYFPVNQYHL